MSVKKLLVLSAAGLASVVASSAIAGGPDVAPPPAPVQGLYIDGAVGYALADWESNFAASFWRGGKGSYAAGGDIGYQWSQYLGAETGWYYVGGNSVTSTDAGVVNQATMNTSWFGYVAAKMTVPLTMMAEGMDAFGKAGVAYRYTTIKAGTFAAGAINFPSTTTDWLPYFALGLTYHINPEWSVNGQYQYVGSGSNVTIAGITNKIPSYNVFTLGVGYFYAM